MRYKLFSLFVLTIFSEELLTAQENRLPFPQHVQYTKGVIRPDRIAQRQMDDSVISFYKEWKAHYVKSKGADGYYVSSVHSAGLNNCVSEGQGYGMMIVVFMAGYDSAAQSIYDGLFRYYRSHASEKSSYLMSWAQNAAFQNVDGSSAADGDMDIAYSLLQANRQWGSDGIINYKKEAGSVITAIMEQEINHSCSSVLLSNAIEADSKDYYDMRSSDFMPAHFKAFEQFAKDGNWNKVVDRNYKLFSFLQSTYSPEAGLFPDFILHIDKKPVPAKANYLESKYDGYYNYNACRVPWRIATDYILNADDRSKEITEKINNWIRETCSGDPDNISAGYTLAGDDIKSRNFEAMSFIASFTVAAMIDRKYQPWLNKLWDYIESFTIDQYDYYDNSIRMIGMIILSGNYWKPY